MSWASHSSFTRGSWSFFFFFFRSFAAPVPPCTLPAASHSSLSICPAPHDWVRSYFWPRSDLPNGDRSGCCTRCTSFPRCRPIFSLSFMSRVFPGDHLVLIFEIRDGLPPVLRPTGGRGCPAPRAYPQSSSVLHPFPVSSVSSSIPCFHPFPDPYPVHPFPVSPVSSSVPSFHTFFIRTLIRFVFIRSLFRMFLHPLPDPYPVHPSPVSPVSLSVPCFYPFFIRSMFSWSSPASFWAPEIRQASSAEILGGAFLLQPVRIA
ncbi:hypothetical protein CDAR_199371 [Caerostris darwini]|uniref:Secreted protein n=1 Tax=Caerostris darwini TaxID=1538125 RepID=A0AAV4X214_9ARAC|nr:hypothetical protein CDAR_199371 [Caerostris darwini]